MKQQFLGAAAITAFLLGAVPAAHAVPTLSFSVDGGAATFCADGALCDANVTAGVVTFTGVLGGVYEVNVTTGVSKPALTTGNPLMDINTLIIDTTAGGSHTLVIMFSDTGFSLGGQFSGEFGGVLSSGAGASILASAYSDAGDTLFAATTLMGAIGPFGPGAFSGTFIDGFAPGSPYSVTQVLSLTTVGASTFSGDFEVNVPEPGTLALLGLGLAFAGFMSRRREKLA